MNTKTKGEFSEARVLYEFQKYHIPVSLPWGDNQRYDMIAEFNGKLNRIQVKTVNEEHNGAAQCYCRSSQNHTTNKNFHDYNGQIDYFVFYNQIHDKIAIIPIEELEGRTYIRLRLEPSKNNQAKNTQYFEDYSFDKLFKN